jgi:hypothetical protein
MNDALQLESRFSLSPNSLGYCGLKSAANQFRKCIKEGKCTNVKEELKKFIVLYPYLKTLAKISKLSLFSYPVIESYWLGNDLLKKAKQDDYLILLKYFEKQGVPDFFVKELKKKIPKVFVPNHLFQVLHVGVGKASKSVPFNIKTINDCMIRWGKIKKIFRNKAAIELNSLKNINKNSYTLTQVETLTPIDLLLTSNLRIGDMVAVHWNLIVKILTKEEESNLRYWTDQTIKCLETNEEIGNK